MAVIRKSFLSFSNDRFGFMLLPSLFRPSPSRSLCFSQVSSAPLHRALCALPKPLPLLSIAPYI